MVSTGSYNSYFEKEQVNTYVINSKIQTAKSILLTGSMNHEIAFIQFRYLGIFSDYLLRNKNSREIYLSSSENNNNINQMRQSMQMDLNFNMNCMLH